MIRKIEVRLHIKRKHKKIIIFCVKTVYTIRVDKQTNCMYLDLVYQIALFHFKYLKEQLKVILIKKILSLQLQNSKILSFL